MAAEATQSQTPMYDAAAAVFSRLHHLEHANSLLRWDQMVHLQPKCAPARGACLAELATIKHERLTSPTLAALLDGAEAEVSSGALTDPERVANVREMRRVWAEENKLSADLVQRKTTGVSRAQSAWPPMKTAGDWAGFMPHLEAMFAIAMEEGAALRVGRESELPSAYDALLDKWEPGLRAADVDAHFADIVSWLPALIRDARAKQQAEEAAAPIVVPKGPFPIEQQRALGKDLMAIFGFDFDAGRLDVSPHPFCGGVPEDVRLTTRYSVDEVTKSMTAVIHETGHARYEQSRPRHLIEQPVSKARGFGTHEGQSLFCEMQVGRSRAFQDVISPILHKHFPECPNAVEAFAPANLYRLTTQVTNPSPIRVESDELTYPLHVIIRYEIERKVFAGELAVADIPAVWADKMKSYIGIDVVGTSALGALQDVHWSVGYVGFFATYTFGAMTAAQQMRACREKLGSDAVDAAIASGDVGPVMAWLKEQVWSKGSILPGRDLSISATGAPLSTDAYRAHLTQRYLGA